MVGKRIGLRPLHPIETKIGRLMTVVTRSREGVVRLRERRAVFRRHGRPQIGKRLRYHPRDGVLWSDRRIFVGGMELDDVVEAFTEFVKLIGRKIPIPSLSRQPQLRVGRVESPVTYPVVRDDGAVFHDDVLGFLLKRHPQVLGGQLVAGDGFSTVAAGPT